MGTIHRFHSTKALSKQQQQHPFNRGKLPLSKAYWRGGRCCCTKIIRAICYVVLGMTFVNFLFQEEHVETKLVVIENSNVTASRGKLYYCGYRYPQVAHIFPEYEYVGDEPWRRDPFHPQHDNDILVVGMWGPPCMDNSDEKTSFSGKILYINGEPSGDALKSGGTGNRVFQMGSFPQRQSTDVQTVFWNQHSIHVYHMVTSFLGDVYLRQKGSTLFQEPDVDPFDSSGEVTGRSKDDETKDSNRQLRDPLFDAWKQLTEGNGYLRSESEAKVRIAAVVYVSRNCVDYRQEAAAILAREFEGPKLPDVPNSFVHYGGECSVRGGVPVPERFLEGWKNTHRANFKTNYETIYTRYKYCLVMENTLKDGYVTEKLMHALLGGCLPIYYGTKDVYKFFREDAFVYFDVLHPEDALAEIRRLEADPDEYARRTDRSLPLLKSDGRGSTSDIVNRYFSVFPEIGDGRLCKEIHQRMGLAFPTSLQNNNGDHQNWSRWWL